MGETPDGLSFAEAVADPDRALRNSIATELLREIGHIVQIELRADKQVLGNEKLNAETRMHLEMAGVAHGLGHIGADGGPYARILCKGKTGSSPANSTL